VAFEISEITVNKQNNEKYEALFDDLIQEVFGFSFAPWLEHKLWDEHYESYSIIRDGRMLANTCVYKTDMIVNGQRSPAIQLGAVCTRESERGKGLSRLLTEHILSLYKETPAYLFANESVLDFYPRFGFKQIQIHRPVLAASINNDPTKAVKHEADSKTVVKAINNRKAFSNTLDCLNTGSIQMFHLLMGYPDDIYSLPENDVIVIAQQSDTGLYIADVIARKPVAFEKLKIELPFNGVEVIEFGFCPDWLDVSPVWEPVGMNDFPVFIKGEWNLPETFCFPATSET